MSIDKVGGAMFGNPVDSGDPAVRQVAPGDTDRRPHLCDWTSDGSAVIYFDRCSVGGLWLADPEEIERPRQLLNTELKERWARVSEDGRLIAYVGGDDSQRREIYVQPYLDLGRRIRVSVNGGGEPLWSHDGQTLFFRQDGAVFAAHIQTDPILQAGKLTLLFKGEYDNAPTGHSHYDISLDSQAFLMAKNGQRYRPRSVYVVENWPNRLGASKSPN